MLTAALAFTLLSAASQSPHARTAAPRADILAESVSATDLCFRILRTPAEGRAILSRAGWRDIANEMHAIPLYSEPEAGGYKRGHVTIIFVSSNTSLGREHPESGGVCMAMVDGVTSIPLAEYLGTHFGAPLASGTDYEIFANNRRLIVDGMFVGLSDLIHEPGTVRIMITPNPAVR